MLTFGSNETCLVTPVNIFTFYYLDLFETQRLKPYIEGGTGVIFNVKAYERRMHDVFKRTI